MELKGYKWADWWMDWIQLRKLVLQEHLAVPINVSMANISGGEHVLC